MLLLVMVRLSAISIMFISTIYVSGEDICPENVHYTIFAPVSIKLAVQSSGKHVVNRCGPPETIINTGKDALDCSNALFMLNLIKEYYAVF